MRFADEWWREQVMGLFNRDQIKSHSSCWEKSSIYDFVAADLPLPRLVREEYIDRAVRQLKTEGKLTFFNDWHHGRGWHVPDLPRLRAVAERAERLKWESERRAHDRRMAEHSRDHRASVMRLNALRRARGESEEELPELYVPKYPHLDTSLVAKLEATADSLEKTGHPEAAANYRAKAVQLRARHA